MRRVAENKRKAEEVAREKAIRAHMQKLEYDALPKCPHGLPSDAQTWRDHYDRYHSEYHHPLRVQRLPTHCPQCVHEAHIKKQKEEAAKAAAVTAEAKRIAVERAVQRVRQAKIVFAKHIEEKTAKLRNDKAILNFVGLTEPAWTAETYYVRLEGAGKYVPVADGITVSPTSRPLLGEFVGKTPTPTQWATHFTDGLIPFLPVCPCCAKTTQMIAADIDRGGRPVSAEWPIYERHIYSVECNTHYKWIASTGKHYRHGAEWDPTDPEGIKAASVRRAAELAAAEAQMAELQAKIRRLKAYCAV